MEASKNSLGKKAFVVLSAMVLAIGLLPFSSASANEGRHRERRFRYYAPAAYRYYAPAPAYRYYAPPPVVYRYYDYDDWGWRGRHHGDRHRGGTRRHHGGHHGHRR